MSGRAGLGDLIGTVMLLSCSQGVDGRVVLLARWRPAAASCGQLRPEMAGAGEFDRNRGAPGRIGQFESASVRFPPSAASITVKRGDQHRRKRSQAPNRAGKLCLTSALTGSPAALRLRHEQPGLCACRAAAGQHGVIRNRVIHGRNQMNRINTKMKLLALGLLGLGGFAVAGSAAAVCPTTPSAWTDSTTFGGTLTIASPGLASTSCLLEARVASTANVGAAVVVHDASPSTEPRYRAQFIVDVDALPTPSFSDGVKIFTANSAGAPVTLSLLGNGTSWFVSYAAPGGISGSLPLASGENRVEFDLQIGASGSFSLWLNNNNQSSPDVGPISVNNASMGGINDVYMGLTSPTGFFVANYNGQAVKFDQFDSRRQTFIGF